MTNPEKHQLLVLPFCHLPKEIAEELDEHWPGYSAETSDGTQAYVSCSSLEAPIPNADDSHPDIKAMINYAHAQGCAYILLDGDAAPTNELNNYEW